MIFQGTIVRSIRTASAYHPTNPALHARLAEASAELSMFRDAETEAREALRLDKLLAAHPRERLADDTRKRLEYQSSRMDRKGGSRTPSAQPGGRHSTLKRRPRSSRRGSLENRFKPHDPDIR